MGYTTSRAYRAFLFVIAVLCVPTGAWGWQANTPQSSTAIPHGLVTSLKGLEGCGKTAYPALTCWATIVTPFGLDDPSSPRSWAAGNSTPGTSTPGSSGPQSSTLQSSTPQANAPQSSSALSGAAPGQGQYADTDVCKTCHEDIWNKHFAGTPHAALLKGDQHGCQGCHGPAQAHVEGGGDVTKIIRFETLSPKETAAICTKCHQSSLETQNFARSAHLSNGVSCTSCHSPHNSTDVNFMLVKPQTALCYSCHAVQKAEFARPYRHRVDVGLIQCSDCHNPHGTETGHQVRTAAGQFAVCTKCHTDTMGPFVFEHAPVKTEAGCLNCHTPHGSTNPRLLQVNNVNFLCLRCHTPNMNGAAGAPQGPAHNQSAKYQACTMCHTQIHGSNFDGAFFR